MTREFFDRIVKVLKAHASSIFLTTFYCIPTPMRDFSGECKPKDSRSGTKVLFGAENGSKHNTMCNINFTHMN